MGRPRFAEAAEADLDAVDRLVEEWRTAVLAGRAETEGFGTWLNVPSKVAQVAAVRAYAKDRREGDLRDGTLVAALCPGLVDTDASRPWFEDMSRAQTTTEAAVWPVVAGPGQPGRRGVARRARPVRAGAPVGDVRSGAASGRRLSCPAASVTTVTSSVGVISPLQDDVTVSYMASGSRGPGTTATAIAVVAGTASTSPMLLAKERTSSSAISSVPSRSSHDRS